MLFRRDDLFMLFRLLRLRLKDGPVYKTEFSTFTNIGARLSESFDSVKIKPLAEIACSRRAARSD
ncbi:MAG: hypothetical protein DME18_06055 [Verrucomicrobia bacterium]|nr:MAG: hypothetical protein DME19_15865 [Verrucomicrobiota bacterium]PYM14734.1 MAG: hypothetical protein DME18_06055 [Verrucomicrobiota bacterium]